MQVALEMPEPWLALRTEAGVREEDLARALGPEPDELAVRFLQRLLDTVEEQHVALLGTLSFPPEEAPDAVAALLVSVLDAPRTLDRTVLLDIVDPDWATTTMQTRAGTVVRQERLVPVPELMLDGYAPVCLSVRYVLPMPEQSKVVAVDCSTPSVAYEAEFRQLFDAAAATLRFVESDVA